MRNYSKSDSITKNAVKRDSAALNHKMSTVVNDFNKELNFFKQIVRKEQHKLNNTANFNNR